MASVILSIAGGAGVSLAFVYTAWITPLQANTYTTNGNVSSLTASVGDIQSTLNDQVLPTLNRIAIHQGIEPYAATSTQ